jgi:uncharacterized protein
VLINLLQALALVFIFEGIMPFAFPHKWRRLLHKILEKDDNAIRTMGIVSMILGLIFLTVIHQFVD